MHIHPNNNLLMASLGVNREEVQQIQAKRAAEVRRKLLAASRVAGLKEEESAGARRVEGHAYEAEEQRQGEGEDDGFGRLFSAKA